MLHYDPHDPSTAQLSFLKEMDWPNGSAQTCIAGESGLIKQLRHYLATEKELSKQDTYISGYWKIGLVEDEHRAWKNNESKLEVWSNFEALQLVAN